MVDRENAIQILSSDGIKSASGLSGDDGETRIEFLDTLLPQERVGSFYSGDAPQTQLLRQTPCFVLPARAEELRGPTVSVYRGKALFEAQYKAKPKDVICPWVFHRDGKPIRSFYKAWARACYYAGLPCVIHFKGDRKGEILRYKQGS
jgi:hypothetical protein